MSEVEPPRGTGAHRVRSRSRVGILVASLLGVVVVAAAVIVALNLRGESSKPAAKPITSRSPSSAGANATTTPGQSSASTPSPSPSASVTPPPAATPSPSPTPRPSTPGSVVRPALEVLNNSRYTGLAAAAAVTFRQGGWTVARTGNYRGRVPTTTVYYPSGWRAAAEQLAHRYPRIQRVLPAPAAFSPQHLTVVLARNWVTGGN